MTYTTLLVLPTTLGTFRRDFELILPPHPGMGIRINVYEMLNVDSVVIGDIGYDVTCICSLEVNDPSEVTEQKCISLGFEIGPYP
jgi:hypothetical protein